MIELILSIIGLLILIDILYYIDKHSEIKLKNEILDLNVNEEYSLDDIKSIFLKN